MARERRLHRKLGGLGVADLTDHHDVRVLTQHSAQRLGEGEVDPLVDLCLVHAGQLVLDRVLDGDDVVALAGEVAQEAVQRRGLTGTGGARDQDQALGPVDRGEHLLHLLRREADVGQGELLRALAQDADHDLLAVHRRQRGDTQVHLVGLALEARATVLRAAALGDVHARHQLQTGDQCAGGAARDGHHALQHAVDAVADRSLLAAGLHVDVRGAGLDGVGEDAFGQPDDGGVFDAGEVIEVGDALLVVQGVDQFAGALVEAVRLADSDLEQGHRRDHRADAAGLGRQANVVERDDVGGVGADDDDGAVGLHAQGQQPVALGQRGRDL